MAFKKTRLLACQERNDRIENMNIDDLKKFLCLKNGQNPEKCDSCPGLKGCKAGQRAIILLNEAKLKTMDYGSNRKGVKKSEVKEISKMRFIQALNQPDMIQYLMETYGNSRNCARTNLKQWAKKYPDIAEQYGFEEKLKSLTIIPKTVITGSAAERQKAAIEGYEEASSKDDPIAFVMLKYGLDRARAVHKYGQWKRRYGEKKEEKAVENIGIRTEADEISVEDFLNEVETTTESVQKSAEEPSVPEKQDGEVETKNEFFGELNAKFNELAAEKERLKDRIAWIEKAQDALAMTLNVFNPDSVIGKALKSE